MLLITLNNTMFQTCPFRHAIGAAGVYGSIEERKVAALHFLHLYGI